MAETLVGYKVRVLLVSIEGSTRPLELVYDIADVADETAAEAEYAAWKTDYTAVAEGKVKGHEVIGIYEEGAFILPTSQDAEDGEHAIITTSISSTKNAIINLPFPKSATGTVYVSDSGPGRKVVNTASTALASYLDNFEAGHAQISDGEYSLGNVVRGRRAR